MTGGDARREVAAWLRITAARRLLLVPLISLGEAICWGHQHQRLDVNAYLALQGNCLHLAVATKMAVSGRPASCPLLPHAPCCLVRLGCALLHTKHSARLFWRPLLPPGMELVRHAAGICKVPSLPKCHAGNISGQPSPQQGASSSPSQISYMPLLAALLAKWFDLHSPLASQMFNHLMHLHRMLQATHKLYFVGDQVTGVEHSYLCQRAARPAGWAGCHHR